MELAALIISIISFIVAAASLIWLLSKQLSTHVIQREMVDPFKELMEQGGGLKSPVGNKMSDPFREIGDPIDKDELERIELLRQKKGKMT